MQYYEDLNNICNRLKIRNIVTNDIDAWVKFKDFKKIYNKLWLSEIQNINCGPIGIDPSIYPIIIKPIINLYGMSRGFKKINNKNEYYQNQNDGCFWMPFLDGINYTVDLILDNGKIINYYTFESKPSISGTFEYHVFRPNYKLLDKNKNIIENNFIGYSGPINIEIINDIIIEGHLRLNGDLYLYNDEFIINLSNLINGDKYKLHVKKKPFYLFPYFVYNFNIDILNKDDIENIFTENKIDNIRWDNINSQYQRSDLSRLLMFKVNTYKKGIEIIKKIRKNLYLREKLYNVLVV